MGLGAPIGVRRLEAEMEGALRPEERIGVCRCPAMERRRKPKTEGGAFTARFSFSKEERGCRGGGGRGREGAATFADSSSGMASQMEFPPPKLLPIAAGATDGG